MSEESTHLAGLSALAPFPIVQDAIREAAEREEHSLRVQALAQIFGVPPEKMEESASSAANQMAAASSVLVDMLPVFERIARAIAQVSPFVRWYHQEFFETTKERRARKAARRARRHAFLTHGKHGQKRPRGKRNAPLVSR